MADAFDLLAYARVITLVLTLAGATYLDLKIRRVPNDWWLTWAKPALFLLCLELLMREADWSTWLTASAVVAYASTAVIGRPTLSDLKAGSKIDILVTCWYVASGIGLAVGASTHGLTALTGPCNYDAVVDYCGTPEQMTAAYLWAKMVAIGAVLLFFELCYQLRMLHGGADAKAMMFVALCLPWWNSLPPDGVAMMPPALALLVWGALAFLILPGYVFALNFAAGDAGNLRMSWHARRMLLSEIPGKHVWLLDEVMEAADGERRIVTRMRPSRGGRGETDVQGLLDELAELGAQKAWVTEKYPFMAFLMLGLLPLLLLGDPVLRILTLVGLI